MNYKAMRSPKDELKIKKLSLYMTDREWEKLQYNNKVITKYFGVKRNQIMIDLLCYNYNPQNLRDMGYISQEQYQNFMSDVKNGKIKLSKEALKII